MNISKMASTIILVTAFTTIFLFGIIFYLLYEGDANNLKDALSLTASFFSGISTLVAAYIATQLFNDWREQEKYKLASSLALDCLQDYFTAKDKLLFYLFQYTYKTPPITFKELDDFFFEANNKLFTLNEILKRIGKAPIDQEIINSFHKNNYAEVIKNFSNTEMLKNYTSDQLNECHLKFINNEKMKSLRSKLLDVLELK